MERLGRAGAPRLRCRGRLALFGLASLCLVLLGDRVGFAEGREEVFSLAPGEAREGALRGGETHVFAVVAEAGQLHRVAVEQRRIDLVVAVSDPQGQRLLEVDVSPGPRGMETLSFIAEAAGAHRIEVRPADHEAQGAGTYGLRLDEARPAEEADRQRAAAERGLSDGLRLIAEPKAESRHKAIETLEAALPLWRSLGDQKKETATLIALGRAALRLSDLVRATAWLEEALTSSRAQGDRAVEANVLVTLGAALQAQGRLDPAFARLQEAQTAWREVGSAAGEAEALHNLASVHSDRWDHDKAVEAYEGALAMFKARGDRRSAAHALTNLGSVYVTRSKPEKAIELLLEVLPLRRALGDRHGEALALGSLGSAYQVLGDHARALEYHEAALPLWRELGHRRGEAFAVHGMATVFVATGDLPRARAAFGQALELRRAIGDKIAEVHTLVWLGDAHRREGDRAAAVDFTDRSLQLARQIGERMVESRALLQLALILAEGGELDAARDRCVQAVAIFREIQAPKWQALGVYRLGWIERARGELAGAREHVEEALAILEEELAQFSSADLRAAYVATVREIYELHVDVLMQLHRKDPTRGFDALAFQASERARARSLLELLAEARADIREGGAPELVARERSLRGRLNAAAERRLRLPVGGPMEAAAALDREIESLRAELVRTTAEIRATSPRYAALTQPAVLAPAQVQALLGAETLLLEYFLGEERSYLWALTGTSFTSHELPPRAVLEAAARRAHAAMSEPGGDWERAAADLSRILLAPVADRLGGGRIVFVTDGALPYVPFAALPHPGRKDLILERHVVAGLPSASILPLLRPEASARPAASRALFVLADPVFDPEDERVAGGGRVAGGTPAAAARPRPSGSMALSRATAQLGLRGALPRLPFTRREARAIVQGLAAGQSTLALDFKASQDAVKDPELERSRVVHFATHGILNAAHPELSGIVLSLVDEQGTPRDGFLTAARIFNLRLSADLVVLSGCRTALGKEVRGEGFVGLTRAFMYAGAPRVVASLWLVDDAATAQLMAQLHRGLRRGTPASESLRAAQLALLKGGRYRHPYYWAAFALQGDWR